MEGIDLEVVELIRELAEPKRRHPTATTRRQVWIGGKTSTFAKPSTTLSAGSRQHPARTALLTFSANCERSSPSMLMA